MPLLQRPAPLSILENLRYMAMQRFKSSIKKREILPNETNPERSNFISNGVLGTQFLALDLDDSRYEE